MTADQRVKDQCLWHITAPKVQHYPALAQDRQAQVCVIGGGFTGLSAAIHLAEQGVNVCLLESRTIGSGGSGRNVGLVNAGTWARPEDLNGYMGEQAGERLTAALSGAPKLVFEVIDRLNIDAHDTRTGNIHMAHNKVGEADVDIRFDQLSRRGADVEVLTGSRCHDYCGTTKINKALLDKRAGTINPFAYVNGLAQSAKHLGVAVFENTLVTNIVQKGSSWAVQSSQAQVLADKVIIATNAYTEGEWTEVKKTFYFVDYYQIASEPLADAKALQILPYKNGAWDTRLALSSIRRDKDNRLLLGTVGSRACKPATFYQAWANHVTQHYFPDLPKFNWQFEWGGRFGFTTDHIFRVLEPAPGIVTASAYNGRGITTGTMMGKAFADYLISDDRSKIPLPFKTLDQCKVPFGTLRSICTEAGLTLYHSGQCLNIIS